MLRKSLGVDKEEIRICYEAGPTGFVLFRRLAQLGYDCIIVTPSAIPKASGQKVKTDRRDAKKLARVFRAEDIGGINIPEAKDEGVRDLYSIHCLRLAARPTQLSASSLAPRYDIDMKNNHMGQKTFTLLTNTKPYQRSSPVTRCRDRAPISGLTLDRPL